MVLRVWQTVRFSYWRLFDLSQARCNVSCVVVAMHWGVGCTFFGVPCLVLYVTLLSLDIPFYSCHNFYHENWRSLGERLVEVSSSYTTLERPYKHFLVQMYDFDGPLVETDEIHRKWLKEPLADIKNACGWYFSVLAWKGTGKIISSLGPNR